MPVNFNLKRDPTAGLPPAGIHRFVVEKVEERSGPKGAYLNMTLRIYVNGVKWNRFVWDILSTSPESKFRVDQFFDAVGAPEAGSAGESWFINKTGWAKFNNAPDQKGVLQTNVVQYLTEEQAELQIAAMTEEDGSIGAETVSTARSSQPAASPTRKTSGKKSAVAEMDEDEAPF